MRIDLLDLNHFLKHHARRGKGRSPNRGHGRSRGRGRGRDVDVIVVAIMVKNVILILALIIHQIKRKKERMRNVKQLGNVVFDVVEEVIMHVIVVLPNIWLSFIKNH